MIRTFRPGLIPAILLAVLLCTPAISRAQGVLSGEIAADAFGGALRGAGDLNGDGFQDFVVGAPGNDAGGTNAGRVYIYFGRAENLPDQPDLVLTGALGAEEFGAAVAGIGRFNGDSYDDLAVGAPYNNTGGSERGRVYVFYGGNPMNATADVTLSGQQGGDHFGFSLDGGFDFNSDGYADLAVGAPDRPTNGLQSGEVRIFQGGSSPSTTAAVILLGDQALDQFGWSVHGAGDVNNDSHDDLVVGAPQPFALNPGHAYVFFGRAGSTAPTRLTLTGENGGDRFGWSVGGGGNANNDSYDDVVIGAPRQDAGATNNGAAYLFLGGSAMNADHDARVAGQVGGDALGSAVALDGDYDDDGRSDLIAGAPGANGGGSDAGEIDLWHGGSPLNTGSREVIPGPQLVPGLAAGDNFGTAVAFVDYNDDGHSEVLGGAPTANLATGDEVGLASITFHPGTLVPVVLLEFTASGDAGRMVLTWRVAEDAGLIGFHVESRPGSGDWRRLTTALLSPVADGFYRFEDPAPEPGGDGRLEYRLVAIARDGRAELLGPFPATVTPVTAPRLAQNRPNPFRGATTIELSMPREGAAVVEIFDATGRLVRRLFEGSLPGGTTTLGWDGTDEGGSGVPGGTYFCRAEAGGLVLTRKLVRTR